MRALIASADPALREMLFADLSSRSVVSNKPMDIVVWNRVEEAIRMVSHCRLYCDCVFLDMYTDPIPDDPIDTVGHFIMHTSHVGRFVLFAQERGALHDFCVGTRCARMRTHFLNKPSPSSKIGELIFGLTQIARAETL